MSSDEYDKVELPALEQLQSLGWNYIHGSQLSPEESTERSYYRDVALEDRLSNSILRINPWINDAMHPTNATIAHSSRPVTERNRNKPRQVAKATMATSGGMAKQTHTTVTAAKRVQRLNRRFALSRMPLSSC